MSGASVDRRERSERRDDALMPPKPACREISLAARRSAKPLGAVLCVAGAGWALLPAASERRPWRPPTSRSRRSPRPSASIPAKVRLGERLFRDPRLSHDNRVACVSCHRLDEGGDDGRVQSIGADGRPLDFNTPTVFNAALSFRLNWRGNFRTLEEQAEAVLLDPRLMNTSWEELLAEAARRPRLRRGVHRRSMAPRRQRPQRARCARRLPAVPDHARRAASTATCAANATRSGAEEERGYELFKANGCIACHQGVNVGGNLFQRFGIFHDPFARSPRVTDGRPRPLRAHRQRQRIATCSAFRACATSPPPRPTSTTAAPPRSSEAVDGNGAQPARPALAAAEIGLIVRFLRTLTGEYRGRSVADRTARAAMIGVHRQDGAGRPRPAAGADLSPAARLRRRTPRCTSGGCAPSMR